MKTMLEESMDIIKGLVGHDYLYFDHAVEVKVTPHSPAFQAWAVCVSPEDRLYIMDHDEQWHQLELDDNNASLVIGSLYQRLKLMRVNYAKAS